MTQPSDYSTLEVSRRDEPSTLEVDPRQYFVGLEAKPTDPGVTSHPAPESQTLPAEQQQPPLTVKAWWRRHWAIMVGLSIVVAGGIIGGAIGGTLASKKNGKESQGVDESATTSSFGEESTNSVAETRTTSSESSTTITTTIAITTTISTATTRSFSTITPTKTPGPREAPRFPIYIGEGDDRGDKFRLAFIADGTSSAACKYGFIPASTDVNPCGYPFVLADGFEYIWNGCGGGTWVTWRNPSSDDTEYRRLHDGSCDFSEQRFSCGGTVVTGSWLCRNHTG